MKKIIKCFIVSHLRKRSHLRLKLPEGLRPLSLRWGVQVRREPRGAPRPAVQRGEAVLVVEPLADGGPLQTFRGPRPVEDLQARREVPDVGRAHEAAAGGEDQAQHGATRRHRYRRTVGGAIRMRCVMPSFTERCSPFGESRSSTWVSAQRLETASDSLLFLTFSLQLGLDK